MARSEIEAYFSIMEDKKFVVKNKWSKERVRKLLANTHIM